MSHFEKADWQEFIQGQLEPTMRRQMEDHLYDCDQCLEAYISAMENVSTHLSAHLSSDIDSSRIMEAIRQNDPNAFADKKPGSQEAKVQWYQRTIFQYAVAASITMILMTAGVFQGVTDQVVKLQEEVIEERDYSFSEKIMEQTIRLLDTLHPSTERGGTTAK